MGHILKKLRKSKQAVSDIIANILILGITVTLFSGVFWYVATMPGPSETVYGDFSSSLVFEDGANPHIVLVHEAGQPLKDFRTRIHIIVDEVPYARNITDSVPSIGDSWDIGETWDLDATSMGITTGSRVEVMIVDYTVNSMVWSGILLGSEGKSAPIIMDRWVSVQTGSIWTRTDSILQTQSIKVFAKAVDVDSDITGVYANLTALDITTDMGWGIGTFKLNDTNNDGTFTSEMEIVVPIGDNNGTKLIPIIAVDSGGRRSTANMVVTVLPYTTGPPSILYAAIEPSSSLYGSPFTVRCYVTDPNENLNKSTIMVSNDEGESTLGLVNTSHATPMTETGLGSAEPEKLRVADDSFLAVPSGGQVGVTSWTIPTEMSSGSFRTAVLKVRYYTEDTFNSTIGAKVNVSSSGRGLWILQWSSPIVRVFNIGALGYDTGSELQNLPITFVNTGAGTVYFDYWWLEVTYSNTPLSSVQRLQEDPFNPSYFTGVGVASYDISLDVAFGTYYYTLSASDYTGNEVSVRISHTVVTSEAVMNGGGGGRGSPPGNLNYSALQGFNIFEWNDWSKRNYSASPVTHFTHGQNAVVVVASKYLVNLDNSNTILVMDPTSKKVMTVVSSPINYFVRYDFNSGYYVYNCTIRTGLIPDNALYLIEAQLRDSWVPNNIFFMNQMISVGSMAFTPSFLTFKDSAFTIQSTQFSTTDKMYVEIRGLYGAAWNPNGGDVEIRDFFWNAQIKRTPPYVAGATSDEAYNGPVSNVWQVPTSPTKYRFVISLYNATTGSPWIPGTNSYVLRYDMFKAGTETYLLTKVVNITAPKWKADVVVGGTASGNGRFATYSGLFYYQNDNQWSPPDILETSGDTVKGYAPNIKIVRIGDMDGDMRNDFVEVRYDNLATTTSKWYLSIYFDHGGWTRLDVANLPAEPKALGLGNVDLDNDLDILVGYSGGTQNNAVFLYRNDGLWTMSKVGEMGGSSNGVVSLKVADMDPAGTPGNDESRSWDVVVGRASGIVTIYKNTFGTGATWTATSISSGVADVYDWAMNDINVYGSNSTGTSYLDTRNPYQDDGIYELLAEAWQFQTANTWPTPPEGPLDDCSDDIGDLKWDSSSPYTVLPGHTANVDHWDATNLTDSYTPQSVYFSAKFRTYGGTYTANDAITWWSLSGSIWQPHAMFSLYDTGGEFVTLRWDLTSFFSTTTTSLSGLNVTFKNNDPVANVDFYWAVNVTYVTGDSLDHRWRMDLRPSANPATAHTFSVYIQNSASADSDSFKFSWGTDGVTFPNDLVTVSSTVLPMRLYTASISGTVSGTIYVRVTDVKAVPSMTPSIDWIRVGQMTVKTSAPVAAIGTAVLDLDVRDMNGDGANDMVVVTLGSGKNPPGKVWVGFNGGTGILSSLVQVIPDNTNFAGVKNVEIGRFFGSSTDPDMDIMMATSSTVYFIRNNGGGSFAVDAQSFAVVGGITKALEGDVDGNGWSDVVVITANNNIVLYANYGSNVWQMYGIDNLGGTCVINDADLGVLQS